MSLKEKCWQHACSQKAFWASAKNLLKTGKKSELESESSTEFSSTSLLYFSVPVVEEMLSVPAAFCFEAWVRACLCLLKQAVTGVWLGEDLLEFLCLLSWCLLLFSLASVTLEQYYWDWTDAARQQGALCLQEGFVPSVESSSMNRNICRPMCLQSSLCPHRHDQVHAIVTSATKATASLP